MQRHDLLRATPDAWADMLALHSGLADMPLVADWARDHRPVIVRRYLDGEPTYSIPSALALPPSLGKRRIAMTFAPGSVLEALPPVLLREARVVAPVGWQPTVDALVVLGETLDCPSRVFGALMWQHLTSLTYLSRGSDLDLLWAPRDAVYMTRLVDALAAIDAQAPMRLDGEIILPDGGGVNWRELLGAPDAVLVKTLHGVDLRARKDLFR